MMHILLIFSRVLFSKYNVDNLVYCCHSRFLFGFTIKLNCINIMKQCYKKLLKIVYSISSKYLILIAVDKWCMFSKDEIGDFSFVQNMILQNCKKRKFGIK